MITILYSYRNRDLKRIKSSLNSLEKQKFKDFKVIFVDYGSEFKIALAVQKLVENYSFATYFYTYNQNLPWSRSKAINVGLNEVKTDYVFMADVDIVFNENFTKVLASLVKPNLSIYFKVGFLSQKAIDFNLNFHDFPIGHYSQQGAEGLSLFPIKILKEINGFDEFFHFWGAEDADVHNRLQLAGYDVQFYNQEVLLLHQWHPSYRSGEKDSLTKELQCSGIVQLNHEHLRRNKIEKRIVTQTEFGKTISKENFELLNSDISSVTIQNKVWEIDHFLYYTLPNLEKGIHRFDFELDTFPNSFTYKIKKIVGKKVPMYYNLKQINDFLLLHIIGFYHQNPYQLRVADNLQKITFIILKEA